MPQTPFQWFVPATTGTGLVPAAGYFAKLYSAGTTTPKAIYTDPDLDVAYPSPSNTAVLDAEGRALIYLGAGGYKLVICKPDDTPVYTQDNIAGENSFGTGFVDSFADLAGVNTTLNKYTYIGGYYTPGDGGEGMFYNETSATAGDGGYVQDSTFDVTKKWFRIPDENGKVRSASFGAIGLSVNRTSSMLAANTYAASINASLLINTVVRVDTMTFTAPSVEFVEGASVRGWTAATVTFNGIVSGPLSSIFVHSVGGGLDVVLANVSQESNPYWFEGSPTQSAGNNVTSFAKWKAAGAGLFILPPGSWPHTGSFTPHASRITIFFGSVTGNLPGTFYGPASILKGSLSLDITGNYGFTGDTVFTGQLTLIGALNQTGNATITGAITVSGVAQVGSLVSDDTIAATTEITAGSTITAGNAVIAGNNPSLPGYVQARAGTSGRAYKAGGSGNIVIGTGDATLEEGALVLGGDYIKIICAGTTTSDTPTITVTVQGVTVFSFTLGSGTSANPYDYRAEVLVFRTGAATAYATGYAAFSGTSTGTTAGRLIGVDNKPDSGTLAITWANVSTIAHTITPSGTKQLTMYEIYPAS